MEPLPRVISYLEPYGEAECAEVRGRNPSKEPVWPRPQMKFPGGTSACSIHEHSLECIEGLPGFAGSERQESTSGMCSALVWIYIQVSTCFTGLLRNTPFHSSQPDQIQLSVLYEAAKDQVIKATETGVTGVFVQEERAHRVA